MKRYAWAYREAADEGKAHPAWLAAALIIPIIAASAFMFARWATEPRPAEAAGEVLRLARVVRMVDESQTLVSTHLTAKQLRAIERTLPKVGQMTLGPQPLTEEEMELVDGPPGREVELAPAASTGGGDGTRESPYVGAIADALRTIGAEPATLIVPAGTYQEMDLVVPEGTRLRAERGAVLVPPADVEATPDDKRRIVNLSSNSAIVGFEIDGSAAKALTAVWVLEGAEAAVVAANHIYDIPGRHGVSGDGTGALVISNLIERTGRSGIRAGSDWLVRNNVVRYAGIDREGGGGGDDGIIANAATTGTRIENNLVISAKRPNGRHALANQSADDITMTGNLCILEGRVRGGIVLADYSSGNHIAGNVVICIPDQGLRSGLGILAFGSDNIIEGNVVIGVEFGCSIVKERSENNTVRSNYTEGSRDPLRLADGAGPTNKVLNNEKVTIPAYGQ